MTNEHRRSHRIKIELPASFKASKTQSHSSVAIVLDISATGICITSRDALDLGQELTIQVRLPTEEKLTVKAKVVWIREKVVLNDREYSMGIKLLEPMNEDEAKFVRFYVSKLFTVYRKTRGGSGRSGEQDEQDASS